MTDITPDKVRDLLAKATDGPWYPANHRVLADDRPLPVAEWITPANADLIAHAPQIAAAYLHAIQEVERCHKLLARHEMENADTIKMAPYPADYTP